jgi:hypothetical protein
MLRKVDVTPNLSQPYKVLELQETLYRRRKQEKAKNKKRKKEEKNIYINQRRFIIETTIHYNAL